jgi:DNA helicase-2/ATP-dependent DNA helicase PcrA
VRTHAQIGVIADALRVAAIPHRVRGGDTLLDRSAVRGCLDLLRRSPGPLAACLPDLEALAGELQESGAAGAPAGDVATIVQLAHDHLRLDPRATATGFAAWLVATLQAEGPEERRDAVTIATFHAAKGLEWPIVHLAGLEDGFVPVAHARNNAQRAEEARLLYVAMTRAEDELCCTWAASRAFGTKTVERRLTPWLQPLADAERRARTEAGRPDGPSPGRDDPAWAARIAEQRARLAQARPVMSATLAALHAWRDEHARAARVDPEALVDDRLLETIAECAPATHDELAAVPGMGPLLAARVGDGLLAALREPAGDDTG